MLDTNKEFVSLSYQYYKEGELKKGKVIVLKAMQFSSGDVQHVVAKHIAEKLKAQGKFVWRNGQAVISGTSNVDKSSGVDFDVDGPFDSFTLRAYDAGAPIHLLKDQ